ncbi:hypothetical protein ERJ75_001463000 [Trypanosoma vivax]|nr:hypothetical protein ERJ75_001463000 [Trypanosoma vivax]
MSSFTDTSLTFLRDAAAVAAAPREPGKDLIVRYRRQRLRREELLANQQGLGKLGLMIPRGQVMEKWRRSRELMVLDPLSSSQPVSRRFSESLKKIEEHALKCLTNSSKERGTQVQSTLIRQQQLPPALYNFHDLRMDNTRRQEGFPTDGPPAFGSSGKEDGRQWGNELTDTNHVDEAEQGLCVPLISPLRTSFDPRATFATDADVINRENIVAEELALRSKQYSQSICFPSHESQWERSEAYDAAGSIHNGSSVAHSQRHHRSGRSTSRRGSMSRASSRASSVALEASVGAERKRARSNASIASNTSQTRHDWRALAKRAILQQLTLYLRGINSRPKVLNEEQFKATAKKLLERAMRTGSERLGLSMSLQANNANVPFTKDTETRLRKSVDNYVSRHYVCGRAPVQQLQNSEGLVTGRQSATRSQDDDDDDTRSVMGAHLHATDSPVYDQ